MLKLRELVMAKRDHMWPWACRRRVCVRWCVMLAVALAPQATVPAGTAATLPSHGPGSCGQRLRPAALRLRGGGRKLQAKPKRRGKKEGRRGGEVKHESAAATGSAAAVAVAAGGPPAETAEGPHRQPASAPIRSKARSCTEVADMIKAAADQADAEQDVDDVGLPYQESTPLRRGHVDKVDMRDANSYCAEAARCLDRCEPEDAEACYQEALKLEPKAPWILNAYASLLADQGRIAQATSLFQKSVKVDANNSYIPHMYLGQVCVCVCVCVLGTGGDSQAVVPPMCPPQMFCAPRLSV